MDRRRILSCPPIIEAFDPLDDVFMQQAAVGHRLFVQCPHGRHGFLEMPIAVGECFVVKRPHLAAKAGLNARDFAAETSFKTRDVAAKASFKTRDFAAKASFKTRDFAAETSFKTRDFAAKASFNTRDFAVHSRKLLAHLGAEVQNLPFEPVHPPWKFFEVSHPNPQRLNTFRDVLVRHLASTSSST